MDGKILTLHPDGKAGVNIEQAKYKTIKAAILNAVAAEPEITFANLTAAVKRDLAATFAGSIPWYVTTVKLDLEARDLVERVPNSSPQRLRLPRA